MIDGKGVAVSNGVVQVPGWERYGWLRHGFSARCGGVSTVYRGGDVGLGILNLGWTAEVDPAAVAENRRRFLRTVAGDGAEEAGMRLVTVRQEHGAMTQAVLAGDGAPEGRLETAEGKAVLKGDGLM